MLGGLFGAALGSAGSWKVLIWSVAKTNPKTGHVQMDGIYYKVVIPMISSPVRRICRRFFRYGPPVLAHSTVAFARSSTPCLENFRFSVALTWLGRHGFADGQKTMGIMALAVFSATRAGHLDHLPPWLQFLHTPKFEIATWGKMSCGLAMAMGTYIGGWKIIKTLGQKLVTLKPVNGFAAETTGATILLLTGDPGHARLHHAYRLPLPSWAWAARRA